MLHCNFLRQIWKRRNIPKLPSKQQHVYSLELAYLTQYMYIVSSPQMHQADMTENIRSLHEFQTSFELSFHKNAKRSSKESIHMIIYFNIYSIIFLHTCFAMNKLHLVEISLGAAWYQGCTVRGGRTSLDPTSKKTLSSPHHTLLLQHNQWV